jgi:hypothetical protein
LNLVKKESGVNLHISLNNFKLTVGTKEILVEDRFTLILGKFKKGVLNLYHNKDFLEIIDNLELIPVKKFIKLFQNQNANLSNLDKSLNILDYLSNYSKIMEYNLEAFSDFNSLTETLLKIFRYIFLTEKKNQLSEELELSKLYKKSSDLASIIDLIKKLNEAIIKNKKELNYLEEDYFQQKNQVDQIKKELRNHAQQIRFQNETKKECFSQINRITRQIEGSLNEDNNDSIAKLGIKVNLTNAEKIRALQKKAKEAQYEIKQIQSSTNETKVKLENLTPHYELYKNDYENLLETIKKDEIRIKEVKSNYEKKRNDNKTVPDVEPESLVLKLVRNSVEIEDEIEKTISDLDKISIPEDSFNIHNLSDLTRIIEKLREFDNVLKIGHDKINISTNEKEVAKSFESFKKFETIIHDLEIVLNSFLKEIHLEILYQLVISNDNMAFLIQTNFIRNYKEKVNFEGLTTPEKIYFIVVFFLSIKILLKSENILFSNLFIPNIYNKGGSIYRTIRKILPIFETNDNLSNFKLIFLMSNLELKKEIENLKVLKVEES